MFAKMRSVLLASAVVLLLPAPTFTWAQNSGEPPTLPPVVREAEAAYRVDATAYVAAFGGTLETALYRLKLQPLIADLDATLQTKEANTFAGLWIEHTPRFRVVVQFTENGPARLAPYVATGPLANLVEVQTAPLTLAQLRTLQAEVLATVAALGLVIEADIDLRTSTLKIYATDRAQVQQALSQMPAALAPNVQILAVAQLSQPQANWYAGNALYLCTGGFSLWNSTYLRFASTAAHCATPAYSPLGAPVFSQYQGAYDFQVNPAPTGATLKNWAADNGYDATPYYREITSWWPSAPIGTSLCKYGAVTGFTCGVVESNNYGYRGSNTWLLVRSTAPDVIISCNGDSGSPVYSGPTAIGVLSAGWCVLNNNKFIAMPVGKYGDYGYAVMTAP